MLHTFSIMAYFIFVTVTLNVWQLISAFVFATRIVQVGNPEDRFSQRGSYYVNKLMRYGYVMFFKFLLISFQMKNNDDTLL